jgi:glycosyltransferase involved in cell wall biosynthesis
MGYLTSEVSVILPAYNEAGNIGLAIAQVNDIVKRLSSNYEIVVVDDGSHDGTSSEALRVSRTYPGLEGRVRVVSYRPNQGKGFAFKKGFEGSKGDYVIFIDSDLDISPNHLSHYIAALKGADIVAASKFHPDSKVESPAMRKVLSIGYHWLVRIFLQVDASDTQAGLKAFRRSALERIVPALVVKQFAFDAEVFAVANLCGLRVKELPVDIKLKASFPARSMSKMIYDLFGIAYRKHVTRYYQKMLRRTSTIV